VLTAVERVLILKGADLLREVGPRHLLRLAEVTTEFELAANDVIYKEEDLADALYMMVEGRVRLSSGGRVLSEVGPGEAFGTWALVDGSERGQRAEAIQDGLALALHRDQFYDVAAGDLVLLQQVVRALAKRLRALASERPEEARVEGEGIEKPEGVAEPAAPPPESAPPSAGAALAGAAMGQRSPAIEDPAPSEPAITTEPVPVPEPIPEPVPDSTDVTPDERAV
jgi:Cyclic nucleotide-binding domain